MPPATLREAVALNQGQAKLEASGNVNLQTILEIARLKEEGDLKGLVVVGCLSERYGQELQKELPEVDAILGLSDDFDVVEIREQLAQRVAQHQQGPIERERLLDEDRLAGGGVAGTPGRERAPPRPCHRILPLVGFRRPLRTRPAAAACCLPSCGSCRRC